ncbi:MAG TPA: AAA family ATPase [Candidatus Eisenbacteria bacterium]|nr:AAA family ATPase [Candidatus Eisenbacteria bacterium]
MYFKTIEICGFKSFANKTTVQFEPGVTAIVGPNGCGKSNISDAIRWVLGEQSAKSLRGSSMEDVIFNGSAAKEAVNFAEVSLTLSNEARLLPIDYDEVTITRRLHRSGESEYLLNKNTVRLKDINELLMGTGIGTESYAIIEQGKMDVILNSKPEDRRVIFEEAAGITKFKSKKKEALRKLEQTDQNLLRVNDIIQEVKRQIGSIERQAKKAEAYKAEFERMKNLELDVASAEFLTFETRRKSKEDALAALKAEEESSLAVVAEVEGKCRESRAELDRLERELKSLDLEELDATTEMRKSQDRILLNRERIGELLERRENLARQAEVAARRIEEFRAEHDKLDREFESIAVEEAEGLKFLETVEAKFAAIEEEIRVRAQQEEAARAALSSLSGRRSSMATELAKLEAQLTMLRSQEAALSERRRALSEEEAELLKVLDRPLSDADIEERSRSLWLEPKIREFKDRLLAAAGDPARLDAEILAYTDDILKTQGQLTENRVRLQEAEGRRRRVAQELGSIDAELEALGRGIASVIERQGRLDVDLNGLTGEEVTLVERLATSQTALRDGSTEKETLLVRLAETRSRQGQFTAKREKIEKDKRWVLESVSNEEAQAEIHRRESEETGGKKEALERENDSLESGLGDLSQKRDEILRRVEGVRHERQSAQSVLAGLENERESKEAFLREARERVHAFELENAEIRHEIDRLTERIFNAYQIDLHVRQEMAAAGEAAASMIARFEDPADLEAAKTEIQAIREKLAKMGPVNLVAIEEFEEMRQRFDFLTKQQADLNQAKDDLYKAIVKINRTTKELFVETFAKVQKHFSEYYRLLFGGGSAELLLLDESDVLESGIEIVARPPGKKLQNISLLSGGEKALTAVALLFSLFKVRPSPFCILDEIDAPLDETNVDRFCGVLKEFIAGSQFILITHNKRTMNLADAMYGITMEQTGVSRVVSVRFSDGRAGGKRSKDADRDADRKEVLV